MQSVATGLKLYQPLNLDAYDYSPSALNGTIGATQFTQENIAGSNYDFTGQFTAGRYIQVEPSPLTAFPNPSPLGLDRWTVLCWFKQTGAGVVCTTSGGGDGFPAGDGLVPLVSKGRGVSEAGNLNLNWILGVNGLNKLGADFETLDVGTNHRVVGTHTFANSVWNMGVVSYNGEHLQLAMNGTMGANVLLSSGSIPQFDSVLPAAIGGALDQANPAVVQGSFDGNIGHVSVWNRALTPAQIFDLWRVGAGLLRPSASVHSPAGGSASTTQASFVIQLAGGSSPVDNSTVTASAFIVHRNGVELVLDTDYSYAYNTSNGRVTLTSLTGGFTKTQYTVEVVGIRNTDGYLINPAASTLTINITAPLYYDTVLATRSGSLVGYWPLSDAGGSTTAANAATIPLASVNPSTPHVGYATGVTFAQAGIPDGQFNAARFGTGARVRLENFPIGGQPTEYGLPKYTISAWFWRSGAGTTVSTGSGGLTAVEPLVTKGMAEQEASGSNCNFFMGFLPAGNVAFDYEEILGPNHPVSGTIAVQNNTWNHAVVTFDQRVAQIYVNGVQDRGTHYGINPIVPDYLSRQIAHIGASATSVNVASGAFNGSIAHVAIWNDALTHAEVQALYRSGTGADAPPTATLLTTGTLPTATFGVQLVPGSAAIDDATVLAASVVLKHSGTTMQQGVEYSFGYNSGNDQITLTALDPMGGMFYNGNYTIQINGG